MFDLMKNWLAADRNRSMMFLDIGFEMVIRLRGPMASPMEANYLTKFIPVVSAGDMVNSEELQIKKAIEAWRKEAGVER